MPANPVSVDFMASDDLPVRIIRSAKRQKTVSSQWKQDRLVVQVPARLDEKTERAMVEQMIQKYRQSKARREASTTSDALDARASVLDQQYFGGAARPASVRWVSNQNKRWGSASLHQRTIRLSDSLLHTPGWVQDYVLVHELAHLAAPKDGHGPLFQSLLNRFERREEADQYLAGFSAGYRAFAREQGREASTGGFDSDED
ncbi:metal-dependent hydrolase [Glutamicibacter uratoxydans]|uniref:Metal-dependent hydrolase n=1 Tax=Glutamicibacter uratoxydans TaxID=43667 RepID=A0A4Y4DQW1_GLUUR|nr:M48 family metallopeptidase [Glutamicibacter uratoxydans]GED07729.1 metal-dependent hydrolase [Glutamicibacter uratoxydans]